MHEIALLTLKGYREWTESLGPRREHYIQRIQAKLHWAIWTYFTAVGALPHHFRYDFAIALVNNIPRKLLSRAVEKIAEISPVPVEYCIGAGETPREGYEKCGLVERGETGDAVVAHIDVANSTAITKRNGPLVVYATVTELMAKLETKCRSLGCIALYLGGDNIMAFLSKPRDVEDLLADVDISLRVGVGIAKRPYDAFVKATEGLDSLRRAGQYGVFLK